MKKIKINESCDWVVNDKGEKFTSTGTQWGNNPKGSGWGYPFIVHNGKLFASSNPNGHGQFLSKEVLPKTEYKGIEKNLKKELSINNRNVSICGRLFPHVNSDGTSILTFWNPNNVHQLENQKMIAALIKLVGDYFKINPTEINYVKGNKPEQFHPSYEATDDDVQELLNHTIELSQKSGLESINHFNDDIHDDTEVYKNYSNKPFNELTPKEKEMFSKLRRQSPRGGEEMRDFLVKNNPHFTQAQWNQMSTIGDSKLPHYVLPENYSYIDTLIKENIQKFIINEIADYAKETNITVCSLDEFFKLCKKNGFGRNGENVDTQNDVAFIEVGSGLPRWKAEVHHYNADAFDFNPNVEGFSKTNPEMMFKHQYYFLDNNENVLKLMYDDNQEINNKTKKRGDKNFYGDEEGDNNATCVNLSAGETNNGKKTRFYYSGAIISSIKDYQAIKDFVDRMLEKNPDIKFVIHCRQGTSRSAAIGTYVARKVAEIKKMDWKEYMQKYYEEHQNPLIQGKKHQFRIGRGSKGTPSYPDGNTLKGLGELEGWNGKGKEDGKSWAHNFIRDYGDMNDKRYK